MERLRRIAEEKGCKLSQLVHAWALTKGEDVIPLIGVSRQSQLEESLECLDVSLSADDVARVEAAVPEEEIAGSNLRIDKFYGGAFAR